MSSGSVNWREVFQYGISPGPGQGEGYWVFAPFLDGEIELFQLSVLSIGDALRNLRTTVVTPDGARNFALRPTAGQTVASDHRVIGSADRFRLEVGPYLVLSSDAADRTYRIQTVDPENDIRTDLVVRPASKHLWPIKGSHYFTTLDSVLEGTIVVKGKAHAVSTLCAFEHSTWSVPTDGKPPTSGMPPFWHYEYIQWTDGKRPFGSFLWHILGAAGERNEDSGFLTAYPDNGALNYDAYEIVYQDIADRDGQALPQSWQVRATRGDESLSYKATVRTLTSSTFKAGLGFSDVLLDCEGEYRGPGGVVPLRGRGRTEYIASAYNPAKTLAAALTPV